MGNRIYVNVEEIVGPMSSGSRGRATGMER